jgi:hypothetical protein
MKNLMRLAILSFVLASSLALAQEGGGGMRRSGYLLDASPQSRDMRLAVYGVLPYGYFGFGGFPIGVGGLFYIPLVKDGFIPPVNDEFGIDFGADVVFFLGYTNFLAFWIPVSVLWTFHFTDTFSAYAKVGVALRIWPGYINSVFPDFTTAVGLNFMISKGFGLRAEAGYPGIKLGIVLNF